MGWDVVWTASTPLAGVNPEPFVLSSAIAGMTKQIKIGTAVHLLHNLKLPGEKYLTDVQEGGQTIVRRGVVAERRSYSFDQMLPPDPIIIAQEVAMVDHISNGRFIYGVGGDTAGDAVRRRHFLEFLEVMKSIWTDEGDFSGFDGEFYNYPTPPAGMRINPKPVQKPHPPILLAVDSQQGFVPMGEMGYRVGIRGNIDAQRGTKYGKQGDSVLKQDVDKYRQAWKDAGHAGNPGVAIRIPTHVAATQKEANRFKEALSGGARTTGSGDGATKSRRRSPGWPFRELDGTVRDAGRGCGSDSRAAGTLRRRRAVVRTAFGELGHAREHAASHAGHDRQGAPPDQVRQVMPRL